MQCHGRAATATLLTPGEFEVDHVAFSADRKRIVYSSNQHGSDPLDEDRKHLWSVALDGGSPQALTHGEGIETEPAIASDGEIALVRMDARMPARACGAGGERDRAIWLRRRFPRIFRRRSWLCRSR